MTQFFMLISNLIFKIIFIGYYARYRPLNIGLFLRTTFSTWIWYVTTLKFFSQSQFIIYFIHMKLYEVAIYIESEKNKTKHTIFTKNIFCSNYRVQYVILHSFWRWFQIWMTFFYLLYFWLVIGLLNIGLYICMMLSLWRWCLFILNSFCQTKFVLFIESIKLWENATIFVLLLLKNTCEITI